MRKRIEFPDFTAEELWQIPAEAWNDLIRWLRGNEVVAARGAAPAERVPDWAVTVRWSGSGWVASVGSGMVGWREAVVRVRDARTGMISEVPLSDGPELALTQWRPEPVIPPWFAQRYTFHPAADEISLNLGNPGLIRNPEAMRILAEEGGWRQLLRAEIWLGVERSRVRIDQAEGKVFLGLDLVGERPAVVSAGREVEDVRVPTGTEMLLEGLMDPGRDVVRVATVWMVSPPGTSAAPDLEPDESWLPFVEQRLFYHLQHRVRVPEMPPEPVEISVGYTGPGGEIIRQLAADLERQDSVVALQVAAARVTGKFWTV